MFEKHTTLENRLEQYRAVRKSNLSLDAVLQEFASINPQSRYIDYWTPKTWPNAFEIIEFGYFCTTGISILMYQTLGHLNYLKPEGTTWKVISNNINGRDGAVFMYNEKMFNLDPMSAVNIDVAKQHYVELTDLKNLHIPLI
jgi:hypothetical protein|tara:strand:+ start:222 stop:647 length:426 start_codon:yes stop_codon:yes gene_type:complete